MTKLPAPADTQQSGVATYTGRHRDPWNRHAELAEADAMPSGETDLAALDLAALATANPALGIRISPQAIAAEWYAALDAREERRQAQNGNAR